MVRLVRGESVEPDAVAWDPETGRIDVAALGQLDGVVHLAGAPIAARRWNRRVKQEIRDSRVKGTHALAEALASLQHLPRVLVSASGIGFYGDRGDDSLDEQDPPGSGFLAEVARQWEAATVPATAAGVRVAMMRFGMVLSADGGALPQMVRPFKLGLGGPVGTGRQYMSWITLDDAVAAIRHVLETESLSGPINTVAPAPVTNREFAAALGRVLKRPSVLPFPAVAVKLLFGQMGTELLLASSRALPAKLCASGFEFRQAKINEALCHVLCDTAQAA